MSNSPRPWLNSASRDANPDDPFEKFKAQRSTNPVSLSGFRARKRSSTRTRTLRWLGLVMVLGLLVVFWQSQPGFFSSDGARGLEGEYEKEKVVNKPEKDRVQVGKEKASFVMLVRNREITDALTTMKQIEDRFNRHYKYPWTFLNDVPFTDEFINHTTRMASGIVTYGLIPKSHWGTPDWISKEKLEQTLREMEEKQVIYGESKTYRHMCRYNSGFFWRHETLAKYDWYWRVEPSTSFYCDQTYDPFTFMRENNKKYSFVISMPEYEATIETLWSTTQEFAALHPEYIARNNSLGFITDDSEKGIAGATYNLCHFWSNFEIGSLNFWRGEAYTKYFEFLDQKGGFYYERWGDAPVHSIAAALFLNRDEIHFFGDVGYRHVPWGRCPTDKESHDFARCICPFDMSESFDAHSYSCLGKWNSFHGLSN